MTKKITTIVSLFLSLVGSTISNKETEFTYEYEIILNSNSTSDLIKGYEYKEYLIDNYNDLINYLDSDLHTDAVKSNINIFAKEGSNAKYENGKIVIYIGKAKGTSIKGTLKQDSCDVSNIRVKFFFSKYFLK